MCLVTQGFSNSDPNWTFKRTVGVYFDFVNLVPGLKLFLVTNTTPHRRSPSGARILSVIK